MTVTSSGRLAIQLPALSIGALLLTGEAAAAVPLLAAIQAASDPATSILLLLLFYPAGFIYGRWLYGRGWAARHELLAPGLVIVGFWLILLKATIAPTAVLTNPRWLFEIVAAFTGASGRFTPGFLALAASVLIWWRGAHLGWEGSSAAVARLSLQLSAILLLVGLAFGPPEVGPWIPVAVLGSFGAGLPALALAQLQDATSQGYQPGRAARWMGWLGLGLALGLSVALATLASPDAAASLVGAIQAVFAIIVRIITWIAGLVPTPEAADPVPGTVPPGLPRLPDLGMLGLDLPPLAWQILGSLILAGLGLIIWQRLWHWLQQDVEEETFESQTSVRVVPVAERLTGRFTADLRMLLRRLFSGLLRQRSHQSTTTIRRVPLDHQTTAGAVRSLRGVYREALLWSARHGRPRRAAETPHEYQNRWIERYPEESTDFAELTRLYIQARYGGQIRDEDAARAQALWQAMRRRLQARRRDGG